MKTYRMPIIAAFSTLTLYVAGCATPTTARKVVAQPLVGLADIHNHQFAYLGFGGLAVTGEAGCENKEHTALCDEELALSADSNPEHPDDTRLYSNLDHKHLGDRQVHGLDHADDPFTLFDGPEATYETHQNPGYSTYVGWPKWSSIDHQQVFWKWLKQAHEAYDGGLSLMSVLAVSNEVVCELLATKRHITGLDCSDMNAIHLQVAAAKQLADWIATYDKGWYRIAYSWQQARDIITNKQLAVILGVEVSDLFGCKCVEASGEACKPKDVCKDDADGRARVDHGVDDLYAEGVRQVFIVHEFDNAFAGAAMFRSELNLGNKQATGHYFVPEDCSGETLAQKSGGFTYTFSPTLADYFFKLYTNTDPNNPLLKTSGNSADCNGLGLTDLGKYLVNKLIDKRMIIDVDHMSYKATNDTLKIATDRGYPVISSHTNILATAKRTPIDNQQSEYHKTDDQLERILRLGGLVAPILQTYTKCQTKKESSVRLDCDYCSEEWAQRYLHLVNLMTTLELPSPGIPVGSDFNGVVHHVAPRTYESTCCNPYEGEHKTRTAYDKSATKAKAAEGTKVWDYSTDGLAHIGLLPGFIQELRDIGLTDTQLAPLGRGADAYVQMWQRIGP